MYRYLVPLLCTLALPLTAYAQADPWADLGTPTPEAADTDAQTQAQDMILTVFYHELGHALIDTMQLPVLGLEEDAADVLSVVLINELWDAASAEAKLRAAAGFWATSAAEWEATGEAPYYGGVHSPDQRRYYTYVCLFYGADPGARGELAADLGLDPDRAASCPHEFDLAAGSWGAFLDELYEKGAGGSITWIGDDSGKDPFAQMLMDEVDYLNSVLTLPQPLTVTLDRCDEPNAYYDPSVVGVTMCTELVEYAVSAAD
jgi:hypothetical protein